MASHPVPGEAPRAVDMLHRGLPDRSPLSKRCPRHPEAPQRLILRAAYVCIACLRDRQRSS
ncbi:hypothetical protein [Streptomyces sp. JJ38]|uniref:hypothetical protein n=1 Tax=Streptomyces sp. JJ38 TaxID=2738128 RepID=UPI001C58C010|nr:hypothetical protein [Streptomyces sp. JJ38]MBW1598995.1 hypothetical protein [Streptomyces sp. JJ38]